MKLVSIDLMNWKCFTHKYVTFNEGVTLLRWPNGTGKTSLIEAILFALFDKRPQGLDFESLRNDVTKSCRIELQFEHQDSYYIIEREFLKSSTYKVIKDGQLIARSKQETKEVIDQIMPYEVMSGLWGYASLALSPILKTDYLFEILESEFNEPLAYKKHFQSERTYVQRSKSALEKSIQNQDITPKQVKQLEDHIAEIEGKIKDRAFVNERDVIKAKQCEADYPKYLAEKKVLDGMTYDYDRDVCLRLVRQYPNSRKEWHNHFAEVERKIKEELKKAAKVHPLAKYPKSVIDSLISDSKDNHRCALCGHGHFTPFTVNYSAVNPKQIAEWEKELLDYEQYDFQKLANSIKYFRQAKVVEGLSHVLHTDWRAILDHYNKETNSLYDELSRLKKSYDQSKNDLAKINELLAFSKQYDELKECIQIVDTYIAQSKAYYANSLTKSASAILSRINSRYTELLIEDNVYKVRVSNEDFSHQSTLAVASLSNGEKTIVALSLILAIRDLFMPDCFLIMDETFVNLDENNLTAINQLISQDKSQWVIVSHDQRLEGGL